MRIGIVNGHRPVLEALRRIVGTQPGWDVAWTAADGAEAVRLAAEDHPDLVLMDLMNPADRAGSGIDGVEATRRIMRHAPTTILVVTSSVAASSRAVFEAMGHGAVDAAATPSLLPDGTPDAAGAEALVRKIALLARLAAPDSGATVRMRAPLPAKAAPPLVVLGASTGGPGAVATVLSGLPPSFPAAIAVVQHVDAQFAQGLADWLAGQARLPVRLAVPGQRLTPGQVLLAAGGEHMVVLPDLTLGATPEPRDCPYRPSVDTFLESAAARWPRPAVAVLLTGMGRDGARGLLECRAAGWHTIAQDEGTSVLYGMPRAAKEIDAAVEVLPLESIAAAITHRVLEGGPRPGSAGEKEYPRR